ncbi:hypothetical protein [Ignatzschineria sp. LJL83]
MSRQLYINGKPASLLQRILAVIIGIGALILLAFFGLAILVIGLGITAVLGIFFWWKTRKIRKQFKEELNKANNQASQSPFSEAQNVNDIKSGEKKGKLYEGEYKEL